MDYLFASALVMGFLGSFHCIGMCGPIALALPVSNKGTGSLIKGRLLYNLGRIFTYSLLGIIAGLLGHTFSFIGWQSNLSIISGISIILFVLFSNNRLEKFLNSKLVFITFRLKKYFGVLLKRHSYSSLFTIGLLNGILPCGFVYLALAGAAASETAINGMIYMALFGAGTLPMMITLSLSNSLLSVKARKGINKLSPVIAIGLALLLIHRGSVLQNQGHNLHGSKDKTETISLQTCK
jgi:uncharacterized protein